MSTDADTQPIYPKNALEFKSSSFSVPVLAVFSTDIQQINDQLDTKISQATEFFKNTPLLVDLTELNKQSEQLDFNVLLNCLHSKNLLPIGVAGGNPEQNALALQHKIPLHTLKVTVHSSNKPSVPQSPTRESQQEKEDSVSQKTHEMCTNMLIEHPIRSGQRIYAKGDLTILSHVSAGAEIMAEGNIHVYGSLRGRALAGVLGNIEARIFCSILEAELISIAGNYKVSEELKQTNPGEPVQIYLQDHSLIIKNLL